MIVVVAGLFILMWLLSPPSLLLVLTLVTVRCCVGDIPVPTPTPASTSASASVPAPTTIVGVVARTGGVAGLETEEYER
jgi:hypothetical protein